MTVAAEDVERWRPLVMKFAHRILPREWEGCADRDDLIAVGMAAAWRAVQTYRDDRGAKLVTWVALKARGAMKDSLRAIRGRRSHQWLRTVPLDLPDQNGQSHDLPVEGDEAALDDRRDVEKLLARLPERSAAFVRAYYLGGCTMREIADAHSLSESLVSQVIARSLTLMRRRVAMAENGTAKLGVVDGRKQARSRVPRTCGNCGELGHYRPGCPHPPREQTPPEAAQAGKVMAAARHSEPRPDISEALETLALELDEDARTLRRAAQILRHRGR